jgi:predicted transposase YdaD
MTTNRSSSDVHDVYDRVLKAGLSWFSGELAAWLLGQRPREVHALDPAVRVVESRSTDALLHLVFADRPDMVLHCELQLEGRSDMPRRMACYLALTAGAEALKNPGAELASVVVYLDRRTYREDPGCFQLAGALGTSLVATYKVVKLWEEDPGPILALENPALCPFVPLMAGNPEELLVQSRQRILEARDSVVPPEAKRELLVILGVLAGRTIADRALLKKLLMETVKMGDNAYIDLLLEQGEARGLEKGRKAGKQEGRAEEARRALLRVLERRFGTVPEDLCRTLEHEEDVERLEFLLDEAVTCTDLDAFRALCPPR